LKEETGLFLNEKDLNFHKTFFVSHFGYNFFYHYFNLKLKKLPNIVISNKEHKAFIWVTKEEALKMPLVMDENHCLKDFYGIK
jgi:hypothetical protein